MEILYVLLLVGIVIVLSILAAIGSVEESWEVVKRGNTKSNNNCLAVITIEKNKLTNEVRSFMIVGNQRVLIDIEYARGLIGHE